MYTRGVRLSGRDKGAVGGFFAIEINKITWARMFAEWKFRLFARLRLLARVRGSLIARLNQFFLWTPSCYVVV